MRSCAVGMCALASVLVAGSASAAVMCTKKSGVVVLRPTSCNKKETLVDPVALGLQGPQGVQGVQGPMGPQGPGAATALVAADGTVIAQSGSLTIAPVASLPGYFGVKAGSDITTKTVLVTNFGSTTDSSFRGAPVYIVCGTGPNQIDCSSVPGLANDNQTLIVVTMASGDTSAEPHGFAIAIF